MKTHNPFPLHAEIVEITREIDFTSETGYKYVLNKILNSPNPSFWNVSVHAKRPQCAKKIQAHKRLFKALWGNYERLCQELDEREVSVPSVLEWPT